MSGPGKIELRERSTLLDRVGIARALKRMAYEIAEKAGPEPYLVGIRTGGAFLANRLAEILKSDATGDTRVHPSLGAVDITLYRDDVFRGMLKPEIGPTELEDSIEGRTVVLVDDVLFTGRTVRAAMDVLVDYGRPRAISLAVLIDRGCRELPIAPDIVGLSNPVDRNHTISVLLTEDGGEDRVVLLERVTGDRA
jgi:pyrimidine operon attenuation protein / uracil phosphoribosyltransferase